MGDRHDKRVVLIRHGNSTYNAWREETLRNCRCCSSRWTAHDAPLSEKGEQQVRQLHDTVRALNLHQEVQLIVTSPLSRAISTARGGFWGPASGDAIRQRPPMVALALVAERLDTACDIGKPRSELERSFRDVDFSLVEEFWWYGGKDNRPRPGQPHEREPWSVCHRRIEETIRWLQRRPETCIAVVGHSAFFQAMTRSWSKLPNCGIMEIRISSSSASESESSVEMSAAGPPDSAKSLMPEIRVAPRPNMVKTPP